MAEHACACANCDPSLATSADRLGPNHFRASADDDGVRGDGSVWLLDGEDVTNQAVEVFVGEDGWVLVLNRDDRGLAHFCTSCGRGPRSQICTTRRTGRVERRAPVAA